MNENRAMNGERKERNDWKTMITKLLFFSQVVFFVFSKMLSKFDSSGANPFLLTENESFRSELGREEAEWSRFVVK